MNVGKRTFIVAVGLSAAMTLTACGGSSVLSTGLLGTDWNNSDVNAQGTYIVDQQKSGVSGLGRWTGYARGEISRYCQ
jgi:hypothetical protein